MTCLLRRKQDRTKLVPDRLLPLAGFEVIIVGRFCSDHRGFFKADECRFQCGFRQLTLDDDLNDEVGDGRSGRYGNGESNGS
jgi:hypothetical protein